MHDEKFSMSSIGKRIHRNQNKFNSSVNNQGSAPGGGFRDDPLTMTPYSQDNLGSLLSDGKPYRNVIKRYWTE